MKGPLLVATTDAALAQVCQEGLAKLGATAVHARATVELWNQWNKGTYEAAVVDEALIGAEERQRLIDAAAKGFCKLILVEKAVRPEGRPERFSATSLGDGFRQAVLTDTGSHKVFLVDATTQAAGIVHAAFLAMKRGFIRVEDPRDLPEILLTGKMKEPSAPAPAKPDPKKTTAKKPAVAPKKSEPPSGSLLSKLGGLFGGSEPKKPMLTPLLPGGQEAVPAAAGSALTVLVPWEGTPLEAEIFARELAGEVPQTVCFVVDSVLPARRAEKAFRSGDPILLSRRDAALIPALVAGTEIVLSESKGRILLVDNFPPELANITKTLWGEKFEVKSTMKGVEGLKIGTEEKFHLAIIGASLAHAEMTGIQLAQKLREQDPELRLIMLVERYPLQTALQGITQVVEVGLDDCLLKPADPSVLVFSVNRALEKRRLILENKRLFRELQTTNEELAQLNNFQSKFFSMVAHDVKNPLTSIKGYAEMLAMKVQDPTQQRFVGTILASSKTLDFLISDLVDFAAIENGKLRMNFQEMDLAHVVREIQARMEIIAKQKEITFVVQDIPELPKMRGDALRLAQVLQNLCANATNYTLPKGSVTVIVESTGKEVRVGVKDTGIGISAEDLPKIFNRFFQAENAKQVRRGGFGLGLKIAREIVQAHGGSMGVQSQLGQGSTFFFKMPIVPFVPEPAPPAPTAPPKPS